MAKKRMAKVTTVKRPPAKRKESSLLAMERRFRRLTREDQEIWRAIVDGAETYQKLERRVAQLEVRVDHLYHRDGHLSERLAALDGQVGGGDEQTSRPLADPSYTGKAKS